MHLTEAPSRDQVSDEFNPLYALGIRIDPKHLADLHEVSGLDYETIQRQGFFSCDSTAARRYLGWSDRGFHDFGRCLAIPYPRLDGTLDMGFVRIKADNPRRETGRTDAAGNAKRDRIAKYEARKGSSNRAYFTFASLP